MTAPRGLPQSARAACQHTRFAIVEADGALRQALDFHEPTSMLNVDAVPAALLSLLILAKAVFSLASGPVRMPLVHLASRI